MDFFFPFVASYDLPLIGAVKVGVVFLLACGCQSMLSLSGTFFRVVIVGCIIFWCTEAATCRVNCCCPDNGYGGR